MEIEFNNVNITDAVTAFHPCYEIDHFRFKFTTPSSTICVILYCFLTLLSFVTVCGNLLVIISVLYFKRLHTPTNSLVLSLAVADLLVGILVFPLTMAFSPSACMYHNNLFCNIRDSVDVYLCTCSIMHLCCISVDRYYAVCQPLMYKSKISHSVVVIMITLSWIVSVILGIGVAIPKSEEKCQKPCIIDVFMTNTVGTILSFYLPLVLLLCFYLKIFLVAQKQARSIQTRMKIGTTVSKMERKATKTLAIVLGVFIFCCTPCYLCITVIPFIEPMPVAVIETLVWLALTNSTLNPFIYAFFYSWFKSAFIIIISGKILYCDLSNTKLQ